MTTGCGFGLTDGDDEPSRHTTKGETKVDSAIAKILANMSEEDYAALISAVETERGPKRPAGVREAAEAYRAQGDSGAGRIPGGVSPERLAQLLQQASPGDSFQVNPDQARNIW